MMLGGGGGGDGASMLVSSAGGGGDNTASNNNNSSVGGVVVFGEDQEIHNSTSGNNNMMMMMEDGDRNNSGGNRWPRQETLALLKIRKMGELGYHRSAKKCKEKFENVYKYHKRTKEGRSSKSDGKTYRFFDQLEALDQLQPFQMPPPPVQQPPQVSHSKAPPFLMQPPPALQTPTTISFSQHQPCTNNVTNSNPITTTAPITPVPTNPTIISPNYQSGATTFMVSTSSSTSSDDLQQRRRTGKKRKWRDFFEKLMRDVVDKQEELQNKFLRSIEMRERERSMREEAWRMEEMARLNREHEVLVQERAAAAAKDAAVIAFLQKIAGQQPQTQSQPQPQLQALPPQPKQQPPQPPHTIQLNPSTTPPPPQRQPPPQQPQPLNVMRPDSNAAGAKNNLAIVCGSNQPASSSRWPKAEVETLVKLRTSFEIKYQENGPKGPFWEEISAGMRSLGYNRNAKRCKEKWENINKYFKKVKESNKQRPEDSKTCPYYHLLDTIYKEKKGGGGGGGNINSYLPPHSTNSLMAPPLMVQPEQQWPLAPQAQARHQNEQGEDQDDMLDEDELDEDMEDEEEEGDEEDNNGGTYEVVATASNGAPPAATGSLGTTAVA
uniref:Myb-like domain-containing protein n=1 Tax=Kalanchoe fedtschenkoi TaxID=63787 RepID=A0A7N0UBC0_KALFE